MKIYVANFPGTITCTELSALFAPFGSVGQSEIAMDAFTGVSRGFGYVVMKDEEAPVAIAALHNTDWQGLKLTVAEAPVAPDLKGSYKVGSGPVQGYRFRKN
jgi:RNA recognition motif-containing protein